jgi:hypothetical protein
MTVTNWRAIGVPLHQSWRTGRKQLRTEEGDWERAAGIVARFMTLAQTKA